MDALSAAVGAEPGRADLWVELATALVAAGRAPEAWDAAVRAVELAPRSAASHRAIGSVAAALGDSAQAESAYRHALLLDPASAGGARPSAPEPGAVSGGRHASGGAGGLAAWMASQVAAPDPASRPAGGRRRAPDPDAAAPAARANGSRHAAPDEDGPASGRHGVPEPSRGGRRRAAEVDPEWPVAPPSATGGRRRAPEDSEPAPAAAPSSGGRRRPREDAPAVWPGAGTAPGPDGGPATAVWPGTAPAPDGGPVRRSGPGLRRRRTAVLWRRSGPGLRRRRTAVLWRRSGPGLRRPRTAVLWRRSGRRPGLRRAWTVVPRRRSGPGPGLRRARTVVLVCGRSWGARRRARCSGGPRWVCRHGSDRPRRPAAGTERGFRQGRPGWSTRAPGAAA